jgi:hypothetical protein
MFEPLDGVALAPDVSLISFGGVARHGERPALKALNVRAPGGNSHKSLPTPVNLAAPALSTWFLPGFSITM